MFRRFLLTMIALGLTGAAGCGRDTAPAPRIDPALAYRLAVEAAAAGVRPSGSEALARQAKWLVATAGEFGAAVSTDEFTDATPRGPTVFRNVTATVPGRRHDRFILIGCHYDTKRMLSGAHFIGANDGASGVGALLAMIRAVTQAPRPPPFDLRFVFFDGEECLYDYGPGDGLHGSRRYAAELEKSGTLRACRAVIVLDMIGDRDLHLNLPQGTDPELARLLEQAAVRLGLSALIGRHPSDILDDHTPFQRRGVPVIDLIDFEFGPGNSWWHTGEDSIDKISAESLAAAADLALALAWSLR